MDDRKLTIPPLDIASRPSAKDIAEVLKPLINSDFKLTGKTRTDGSNLRKLLGSVIDLSFNIPQATPDDYNLMVKKGLPKLLTYCIDSYLVTSGESYNLQVWNRIPNSENILIEYSNGDKILSKDINFVFVKVKDSKIQSIIVATPQKMEELFGAMTVPTIKHQLLISSTAREKIKKMKPPILYEKDSKKIELIAKAKKLKTQTKSIQSDLEPDNLYGLDVMKDTFENRLLGLSIPAMQTKNRGQYLEKIVAKELGYEVSKDDLLEGGFPDLKHQFLEIKIQDSPTVDLGKHSPLFPEIISEHFELSSVDVRYLISLVNKQTMTIDAFILLPGEKLMKYFSYVPETSYKVQKGIRIFFFEERSGKSIFIG